MFVKFSTLLLITIFIIPLLTAKDFECSRKSEGKVDEEFAKLIAFTNPETTFPETDENYQVFCDEYGERIRLLSNYVKKCKKGLSKQLLSVVMYTVRLQFKNLCKKNSKSRSALLATGKCVNAAKTEFQKCNDGAIDSFLGIIKMDHKKKIPVTCCRYYAYISCYQTRGVKVKECKQSDLDQITEFIDRIAANAMQLLCGDYIDGSDKCTKLDAPPPVDKKTKRPKSFFMPLVEIFNSFPQITLS